MKEGIESGESHRFFGGFDSQDDEAMNKSNKFSAEIRERATRMVQEQRGEYPSLWAPGTCSPARRPTPMKPGCATHAVFSRPWLAARPTDALPNRPVTGVPNERQLSPRHEALLRLVIAAGESVSRVRHIGHCPVCE